MLFIKHLNPIAIAAMLLVAAPAIAATQVKDSNGQADVRWWTVILGKRPSVTEEVIEKIQSGMDEQAVKALVGTPASTVYFPLSHTTAWDYPYRDSWGYNSTFSTIFDEDHVVVGKVSSRRAY